MAGRAGRRGIDTVGHVFHCNNLFNITSSPNDYKNMLTGPPKMLTSQFKISYNLIISILSSNSHDNNNDLSNITNQLINFMEKSFMKTDIVKEINNYDRSQEELEEKIKYIQEQLKSSNIDDIKVLQEYYMLEGKLYMVSNKQKKKIEREMKIIENNNKNFEKNIALYNELEKTKIDLEKNNGFKLNAMNYIQNNIELIVCILKNNDFIINNTELTDKAIVAMQIQEAHSLALAELYSHYDGFREITEIQLACIFSMFTNISIPEDQRTSIPDCSDIKTREIAKKITDYINKYYDIEVDYQLDTGSDYNLHYELIDYIKEWCLADDEVKCKNLIIKIKTEREIFLGEFIKAILKINNICAEFEKVSEYLNNISLLQKVKNISTLTLKYIATNQSLYI